MENIVEQSIKKEVKTLKGCYQDTDGETYYINGLKYDIVNDDYFTFGGVPYIHKVKDDRYYILALNERGQIKKYRVGRTYYICMLRNTREKIKTEKVLDNLQAELDKQSKEEQLLQESKIFIRDVFEKAKKEHRTYDGNGVTQYEMFRAFKNSYLSNYTKGKEIFRKALDSITEEKSHGNIQLFIPKGDTKAEESETERQAKRYKEIVDKMVQTMKSSTGILISETCNQETTIMLKAIVTFCNNLLEDSEVPENLWELIDRVV